MTQRPAPWTHKSRAEDEVITYAGIIKRRSNAAILFLIVPEGTVYDPLEDSEYDSAWFPLSQIKAIHETRSVVNGTMDSIVVTKWIAKQKGLVY